MAAYRFDIANQSASLVRIQISTTGYGSPLCSSIFIISSHQFHNICFILLFAKVDSQTYKIAFYSTVSFIDIPLYVMYAICTSYNKISVHMHAANFFHCILIICNVDIR